MAGRNHRVLCLGLGLAAWLVMAITPALAQQPDTDRVNAVAEQLSCPTCSGTNVADCPTQTCAQWRDKIGEMLADGYTDQEILDYFAARYGEHVLQVPPRRGVFLWVWILPLIVIGAGLVTLAFLMRGWTRRPPLEASQENEPDVDDEYMRRVEQDLSRYGE